MGHLPWSNTHAAVHGVLRSRALLPPGATALVAVSGGQDSVCLLKLLLDLQPKWSWSLRVVHCDHRWRPDAQANAEFVGGLCDRWGVPWRVATADPPCPTEAAARQWRYRVFAELAQDWGCSCVATGHTASDRAETLIYNLLRGGGADGLPALAWQRPLAPAGAATVVRPLLGLTRAQTAAFCRQFALPLWIDSTNQDTRYARNRIRLELLPYLQRHFNPGVEVNLAHTADLLSAEADLLATLAEEWYQRVVVPPAPGGPWRVARSPLATAPLALQRRVLRRVLQQATSAQVSFGHVEQLLPLLSAPNGSRSAPFPGLGPALVRGEWVEVGGKEV